MIFCCIEQRELCGESFSRNKSAQISGQSIDLRFDDRGISMTEGVIVAPFFILIWMGFIFLHSIYQGAIEAQVQAQNIAFQGAAAGRCEGVKEEEKTNKDLNSAVDDNSSSEDVGGADVDSRTLIDQAGGNSLFDWSHFTVVTTSEVSVPKWFSGSTREIKGKAKLMCNMEPRDGLGDMIYGFLKDIF